MASSFCFSNFMEKLDEQIISNSKQIVKSTQPMPINSDNKSHCVDDHPYVFEMFGELYFRESPSSTLHFLFSPPSSPKLANHLPKDGIEKLNHNISEDECVKLKQIVKSTQPLPIKSDEKSHCVDDHPYVFEMFGELYFRECPTSTLDFIFSPPSSHKLANHLSKSGNEKLNDNISEDECVKLNPHRVEKGKIAEDGKCAKKGK